MKPDGADLLRGSGGIVSRGAESVVVKLRVLSLVLAPACNLPAWPVALTMSCPVLLGANLGRLDSSMVSDFVAMVVDTEALDFPRKFLFIREVGPLKQVVSAAEDAETNEIFGVIRLGCPRLNVWLHDEKLGMALLLSMVALVLLRVFMISSMGLAVGEPILPVLLPLEVIIMAILWVYRWLRV